MRHTSINCCHSRRLRAKRDTSRAATAASTVTNWNEKTPGDFIFAVKVPQVITHERVLVDCEPEFDEFIERMHSLGDKLGPMLLQFPKFDKWVLKSPNEFRVRLQSFFKRASDLKAGRFAVEVRNKDWLDAQLTYLLRDHNAALAVTRHVIHAEAF